MVGLAAVSRRWVRSRTSSDPEKLRRSVAGEFAVGLAVLAVTAALVNAVPGRAALAKPYSTSLEAGSLIIDITVDPAKAGPLAVHVYTLTPLGQITEVQEVTASFTQPESDIGPLPVPLTRAGPGHFAAYGFDMPVKGGWRLDVVAHVGDVEQVRAQTTVRIR